MNCWFVCVQVLRVSLERLLQQMETLLVDGAPHLYRYHRVLLRRQIVAVRSCVSELQVRPRELLDHHSPDHSVALCHLISLV